MDYTINEVSKLSGVSTRTLRYYEDIGLLIPNRDPYNDYRIYTSSHLQTLQHILFYKKLNFKLKDIQTLMTDTTIDELSALHNHKKQLLIQQQQIQQIINNITRTIQEKEGAITMTDEQRFEGLKKEMINTNEQKYGAEIRQKYGDQAIDESNEHILNATQDELNNINELQQQMFDLLIIAIDKNTIDCDEAKQAVQLHKQWLTFYDSNYNSDKHKSIAQMYIYDDRFKEYYDKIQEGMAQFLHDAIQQYA